MEIADFTAAHIEEASQIALQNYNDERRRAPALPPISEVPSLLPFAENNLGVAAFENGIMRGFLCVVGPFGNMFGIDGLTGVFSPMGANGAIGENRAAIYARLYQAAGQKWADAGATSHAVSLYAGDKQAQEQFFRYGFGLRCIDAVRGLEEIAAPTCEGYDFIELAPEDALRIMPLDNLLHESMTESPTFMHNQPETEAQWLEYWEKSKPLCYTALWQGRLVAFILAEHSGETFIQDTPGYLHCSGMYCLPEHRGKGVSQHLLNLIVQKASRQGYKRLGVDFESINPSGAGFWLKHFDAYSFSVVRRIY